MHEEDLVDDSTIYQSSRDKSDREMWEEDNDDDESDHLDEDDYRFIDNPMFEMGATSDMENTLFELHAIGEYGVGIEGSPTSYTRANIIETEQAPSEEIFP